MDVPRIIFHKNSTSNIFVRCQFGRIAPRHKGLHIYYGGVDVSVVDGFGEGISDAHPRVCIGSSLPTLYAGLISILWGYDMRCLLPVMIFICED